MQPSTEYVPLPLASIREPEHRLRETIDPGALGELADSMSAEGLHQPIGARGPDPEGRYEIVWGHRRYLAARLLQWREITARLFPPDYDPLLAAVSENLQRADLNPVEEARALALFRERGQPLAALARLFRRSPGWVNQRLALLGMPEDIQAAVAARTLPLAVAAVLHEIDYEPYRESLIREALRTGATVATVEVWRAHYLSDRERIVQNAITVEEIIEGRATYVITVPCEWCGDMAPFEFTRGWRFCKDCHDELAAAKRQAHGVRA